LYTTLHRIFWIVFLGSFPPGLGLIWRSRPAKGEKTDRGSTAVIVLAGGIGMFSALAIAGVPAFVIHRG
jgi:hypothetical protein